MIIKPVFSPQLSKFFCFFCDFTFQRTSALISSWFYIIYSPFLWSPENIYIQITDSILQIMTTKPTSTLPRLFISIAIMLGVVLVYAKPVPDNYQLDGFLQQQELPNAGEGFVVAYGGGDTPPAYGFDSLDLNLLPQPGIPTSPTPTIKENPTPAKGELSPGIGWTV